MEAQLATQAAATPAEAQASPSTTTSTNPPPPPPPPHRDTLEGAWILDKTVEPWSMSNYLSTMHVDPMAIQAHEKGEKEHDTIHTIQFLTLPANTHGTRGNTSRLMHLGQGSGNSGNSGNNNNGNDNDSNAISATNSNTSNNNATPTTNTAALTMRQMMMMDTQTDDATAEEEALLELPPEFTSVAAAAPPPHAAGVRVTKRSRVNSDVQLELVLGRKRVDRLQPGGRIKCSWATSQHAGHLEIRHGMQTLGKGRATVVDKRQLVQASRPTEPSKMVQELIIHNEETGESCTTHRTFLPYEKVLAHSLSE